MQHVRRVLGELEALKSSRSVSGAGDVGRFALAFACRRSAHSSSACWPVGEHETQTSSLTVAELSDRDLVSEVEERHLDVVLTASQALWPRVASVPLFRDRLMAVLPVGHPLARRTVGALGRASGGGRPGPGLGQSQVAREFYASFLGESARFQAHPASKQSVFALVSAGFGITFATASHAEAGFTGVVFKRIDDPAASVEMSLAWLPELRTPPWAALSRSSGTKRVHEGFLSDRPAAELCEGAVSRHEALAASARSACRFDSALSGLPREHLAIGDEIAMDGSRKLDRQLHRLVVGDDAELQFCQGHLLKRGRVRARDRA